MGVIDRARDWAMETAAAFRAYIGLRAADPALDERYWGPIGERLSAAGVRVSAESSMGVAAFYRCVSILANTAALLPGGVYRRLTRGREELPDHPVTQALWKSPNPFQTPFEFKRVMLAWAAVRGVAFARIYRRPGGMLELWPLHPDRVEGPEVLPGGVLRYIYTHPDTQERIPYLAGLDILVVNALSLDGLRGLGISDQARDTTGLAQVTEQYGGQLFARAARFSGAVQLPVGKIIADPKAKRALADSLRTEGAGPGKWHGVPVLEDGMEWKAISMSNDDAQFLETRRFSVTEIARWFGIPPHMIGDVERSTSWGTGIEAQTIGFVTYGLLPWLTLFEQAFESALILAEDEYVRFNVKGLLRGDSAARFAVYEIAIRTGIYSPNDCRELEDENPREGGDEYVDPKSPQQSAGESQANEPPAAPPDENADANALALVQKVADIEAVVGHFEKRLGEIAATQPGDVHERALRSLRDGAATLGVSKDAVRKLLANAKKGDPNA